MEAEKNRSPAHPLDNPGCDEVWIRAAKVLGFTVRRTDSAYASSDGRGGLLIGTPETLDSDDCLSQLVFHELCHALVQGEKCLGTPDWGLDNTTDDDAVNESACLCVQAWLATEAGLRLEMKPTTVVADYYQALPAAPLLAGDKAAAIAARAVKSRLAQRWLPVLRRALQETRRQQETRR